MTGSGLSLYPALCSAPNTFVGTPSASLASLNVDQQMLLTNRFKGRTVNYGTIFFPGSDS